MNIDLSILDKLHIAITCEQDQRRRKLLEVLEHRVKVRIITVDKETILNLQLLLERVEYLIKCKEELKNNEFTNNENKEEKSLEHKYM